MCLFKREFSSGKMTWQTGGKRTANVYRWVTRQCGVGSIWRGTGVICVVLTAQWICAEPPSQTCLSEERERKKRIHETWKLWQYFEPALWLCTQPCAKHWPSNANHMRRNHTTQLQLQSQNRGAPEQTHDHPPREARSRQTTSLLTTRSVN